RGPSTGVSFLPGADIEKPKYGAAVGYALKLQTCHPPLEARVTVDFHADTCGLVCTRFVTRKGRVFGDWIQLCIAIGWRDERQIGFPAHYCDPLPQIPYLLSGSGPKIPLLKA